MTRYPDESRESRVVLCSWGADVNRIGDSASSVAHDLIILSLLYDKVLIPDEALALGDQLASWFGPSDEHDAILQLFDIGALGVLTHPMFAYGPADHDLRDRSESAPLAARAEYIQRRSTRNADPFQPHPLQKCLYDKLDSYFRSHPGCLRPARTLEQDDPSRRMSVVLREVLSNSRYLPWCTSAFPGITSAMRLDFLRFIDDPEEIARRARRLNRAVTILTDAQSRPVFNRSLGFQAAELLYSPDAAIAMQDLISTCFAAPFCDGHSAAGRYGGRLRELLVLPADLAADTALDEVIVSVEASVDTSLHLPPLHGRFVEGLRAIRESDDGTRLRRATAEAGGSLEFDEQVACWRAVADRLATLFAPGTPLTLQNALWVVARRAVRGAILGGAAKLLLGAQPSTLAAAVPTAALSAGVGVMADHLTQLARVAYNRQEIRLRLEQAVAYRCSTVPLVEFRSADRDTSPEAGNADAS